MIASAAAAATGTGNDALAARPSRKPEGPSLWYDAPAKDWSEALPLGNGRLGAMVFGGTGEEHIQINEQTLWGGSPHDYSAADKTDVLAQLREQILSGRLAEATAEGQKFLGDPSTLMPYQPFVDLTLTFAGHDGAQDYRRCLDLSRAMHEVHYRIGNTGFARQTFISFPDKVLAVRLTADRPGALNFRLVMSSPQPGAAFIEDQDGTWLLSGRVPPRQNPEWSWTASWDRPGLTYAARLAVLNRGGGIATRDGAVVVEGADEVVLLLSGASSYKTYNDISGDPVAVTRDVLYAARTSPYARLVRKHTQDFGELFGRVHLSLESSPSLDALPTDARLKQYRSQPDPALEALYFQYGRYLLISSSRAGGQPANLQGIWNKDLLPAWSSKWTTNINLQMNYWIAESGDLWETQIPLWDLIRDLTVTGTETARHFYNADGWVLHHNTDIWRATAPVDGPWGIWPMGGVWLVNQMWDHYLYSEDPAFLSGRAYPAMKGAVEFALDFLIEAPLDSAAPGCLITCPSVSPENQYRQGDASYHLTYAATMDIELLRELFANFALASQRLGVDAQLREKALQAAGRLPLVKIGAKGQIQEWIEDFTENEPEHRHTSHLYGLYPGHSISREATPGLAKAAARSLELRGDEGTGWSMAWRINLYARLAKGEHAHAMLRRLLTDFTQPNLLDVCPPFQIDGNFGAPAGISEMLLQSDRDNLMLLPGLPQAWRSGMVRGLRARGGLKVDMVWKDGRLLSATIHSRQSRKVSVIANEKSMAVALRAGVNHIPV